jgi:hypothetical protein
LGGVPNLVFEVLGHLTHRAKKAVRVFGPERLNVRSAAARRTMCGIGSIIRPRGAWTG